MALRDVFLAPTDDAPEAPRRDGTPASSLAVLAPARDVPALAAAAGLALARGAPSVLICLITAPADPPPALIPPRAAATRLARSLAARNLPAHTRGCLVVAHVATSARRAEWPASLGAATPSGEQAAPPAAGHALAAAGAVPTVLGVAARGAETDALVAGQDAVLVALPPSADPALAELALAGAAALGRAAAVTVRLDPLARALALGGVRAPGAVARAVRELV